MQTFVCPQCGHQSSYDPWVESAHCTHCGHVPSEDAHARETHVRGPRTWQRVTSHQLFLDELLAHWAGTHTPDPAFTLYTSELALVFFEAYRRALGEDPHLAAGGHVRYVRNYQPRRQEIMPFVGAYLLLKRGERDAAAQHLRALTAHCPEFADAWVWLTAATDDPAERIECLENAVAREPAHPLARDALAIARGRVSPSCGRGGQGLEPEATVVRCPRCGGALHYEPGATAVVCPYCGHPLGLRETNLLEAEARLVGDMKLQRRYQGRAWGDVQRIVRCQSCGAELTMTRHLARQCAFCGSTTVLAEDNRRTFERPDGFLPFKLDEPQATAVIHEAQHSGLRGLKTRLTGQEDQPVALQPIYLPFWVFDGFVEVRAWTTGGFGQPAPPGGSTPSADLMMFDNLLFSGVLVPDPAFLKRVFPFDLSTLVPYEPRLLADWPAALYHLDVEGVAEDACETMIALARRRAEPLVAPALSGHTHVRRSFQVTSATYQLVLLPVWVALLRSRDKRRLGLVNGQAGRVAFGPLVLSDRGLRS